MTQTNKQQNTNGKSVKIGRITITHEKSGSSKLRFTLNKTTYSRGLGRLDTQEKMNLAKAVCQKINSDITLQNFNPETWLQSYFEVKELPTKKDFGKLEVVLEKPTETLRTVWENYKNLKNKSLAYNTQINIDKGEHYLDYATSIDPTCIYLENIDNFVNILKDKYVDGSLLSVFRLLNSAVNYAMKQGKISGNPIFLHLEIIRNNIPSKTILAYNKEDVKVIIDTFYDNPYPVFSLARILASGERKSYDYIDSKERAAYYAPLVQFQFLTGCRPSEAYALTWEDIKVRNGKDVIVFNKRVSVDGKKITMGTKNKVWSRLFPINKILGDLLAELPRIDNPNNLIFPNYKTLKYCSSNGSNQPNHFFYSICNSLFNDGKISDSLDFYSTRHTFITHVVRSGKVDIGTLAALVGNSPETIMKNYLASDHEITIPDLF